MSAQILSGRDVAAARRDAIKESIASGLAQGRRAPSLVVILIGEDPASSIYVQHKQKACQQVGITSQLHQLDNKTTQTELLGLISELNHAQDVDGILVQLPLPEHIDANAIIEHINPLKDVDGFHPCNLGRLAQRNPTLRPCTPLGIINLLKHYDISLKGIDATVVGTSNIVGRPMLLELLLAGATVTNCHRFTKDLAKHISQSDLLISATGRPHIIKTEWIKKGAVVVDVGITRMDDGSLRGDIDFETAKEKASFITPVPGGVGPMTVCTLLENTLYAANELSLQC